MELIYIGAAFICCALFVVWTTSMFNYEPRVNTPPKSLYRLVELGGEYWIEKYDWGDWHRWYYWRNSGSHYALTGECLYPYGKKSKWTNEEEAREVLNKLKADELKHNIDMHEWRVKKEYEKNNKSIIG